MTTTHNRRHFLKTTAAAAAFSTAAARFAGGQAIPEGQVRVGLVGCGGRGTGAAAQALKADPYARLVAMGDAFPEPIQQAKRSLSEGAKEQVETPAENEFVGLDAYEKVIAAGIDVILLATPPGFRPQHLNAAIDAGLHVFCEKPMAVDIPGVHSVLEAVAKAREKKLSLVSGFCWRRHLAHQEAFGKVLNGDIGDIQSIHSTYYTGPVKPMPPASDRPEGMADVEWQIRNWYNFSWICGDGLVEQAVHSVDKVFWAAGDKPALAAVAVGGRQIPAEGGNIFDHFSIVYELEGGARAVMACRQQTGCFNETADIITGTKGELLVGRGPNPVINGENKWRYRGDNNDMYQAEHDDLFRSIRSGEPVNDGDWMTNSTLMAIMGRMAAYTGQRITLEECLASTKDLAPDNLKMSDTFDPGPMPLPGRA